MELDFSQRINDSKELQHMLAEQKTRKQINDLPDTAFAYIEPGGRKVDGKTVPHSLRHFPVYNEVSIKRSLAEVGKSSLPTEGKAEVYAVIESKASALGVEVDEDMALGAERYDGKKRSELKDSAFLDPKRRSFPVVSCKNVRAAVSTWGMYKGPMSFEEFKRKLTARAKKLGCEGSLPKSWKDESSAKDWDKIDKDELKHDDKKEKKEHYKDAVKDDQDHIKKLKKDEKIDKEKEAKAGLPPWLEKKKKDDDSDDKDDKDDKKSDKDDKKESKAGWEKTDKKELKDDDKKEKKEHYKDAVKDDKDHIDKLKKDERIDKKKESEAADRPTSALNMEKEYAPVPAGSKLLQKPRYERNEADWEKTDKKELKDDSKKERREHEKDAIKDDKKQIKDLKKDEREDKKSLEKSTAPMGRPEDY